MEALRNKSQDSDDDLSGSVLVDTNLLLAQFYVPDSSLNVEFVRRAENTLKVAAFTSRFLLIAHGTLSELKATLERAQADGKLQGEMRDTENILNYLVESPIFKVVDNAPIESDTSSTLAQHFWPPHKSLRARKHDIQLLGTSKVLKAPILTQDLSLMAFGKLLAATPAVQLDFPFPLDAKSLEQIQLNEIYHLSAPVRALYAKAIAKIQDDTFKVENLELDVNTRNELIGQHQQTIDQLATELEEELLISKELKKLAAPNVPETIIWTIIELALGILPLPVPTSPLAHFIQMRRFQKIKDLETSTSNS